MPQRIRPLYFFIALRKIKRSQTKIIIFKKIKINFIKMI